MLERKRNEFPRRTDSSLPVEDGVTELCVTAFSSCCIPSIQYTSDSFVFKVFHGVFISFVLNRELIGLIGLFAKERVLIYGHTKKRIDWGCALTLLLLPSLHGSSSQIRRLLGFALKLMESDKLRITITKLVFMS